LEELPGGEEHATGVEETGRCQGGRDLEHVREEPPPATELREKNGMDPRWRSLRPPFLQPPPPKPRSSAQGRGAERSRAEQMSGSCTRSAVGKAASVG
jgi:hypothetical protein